MSGIKNIAICGKSFSALITALLATIFMSSVYAQNLDMIGKEKNPFKINGGISVNQTVYKSSDTLARRDPYNYYISGNLNLSLYGWSVPFTFNYSNQKTTFTQPFNNYSLHPQYKWVRAHIGYTSMSFSPYSLNGHLFLGAGVELTPEGPFTFSAMAGRLQKAAECDTLTENAPPPVYERWGYGFKAGYKFAPTPKTNAQLVLSVFHAADKPESLNYIPDSSVYPGENLVIGTNADISFGGHYTVSAELSSSAVSRNKLSDMERSGERSWNRVMGGLIGSNGTTEYFSAYRVNAGYSADVFSIGLGYERIDPGYETFGAYYFNNDMQQITVNGSVRLLEDKVNFSANVGRQNDNLDKSKVSDMKRWVTALNLGFSPNEKLNGSLSYSTFTSFMHIRSQFTGINELTPYDHLDTLNFTQLSSTISGSINYVIKTTDRVRQNTALNLNYQQSSEQQNGTDTLGSSRFYNISAMYGYSLVPAGFTLSLSFNSSISNMPGIKNTTLGPSLSLNKLLLDKKLRNTLSFSYNRSYTNGDATNRIFNVRAGCGYRLGKRHNFSLNLTYMNRKTIIGDHDAISEFIGSLVYSLNF
jgi:hypothetical protein